MPPWPNFLVRLTRAGHFVLDTKADEIATLVRHFMKARSYQHDSEAA
jgi:hypothetical protein